LAPTIHPSPQVDPANSASEPAGRLGRVKLSEKLPHPKALERVPTTGLKNNTKSCRDYGTEASIPQRGRA